MAVLTESYWPADTSEPVLELTAGDLLRAAVADAEDQTALIEVAPAGTPSLSGAGRTDRRWTYGRLLAEAEQCAHWLHWATEARSRGHYFLGTVDDWFYRHVAGIQASEEPGYRDITIAPAATGQLDRAKATTRTPYGIVGCDWRRAGDTVTINVTVPVGATATVHVPARDRSLVTESGRALERAVGVTRVSEMDGVVQAEVGSSRYSFRAT